MFPGKKRFPRAQFPEALKTGRSISSPHIRAILPKNGLGYAVVVPKKTARLSVTRHKIKRRVMHVLKTVPLPPAIILYPRASVLDIGYDALQQELIKLLS